METALESVECVTPHTNGGYAEFKWSGTSEAVTTSPATRWNVDKLPLFEVTDCRGLCLLMGHQFDESLNQFISLIYQIHFHPPDPLPQRSSFQPTFFVDCFYISVAFSPDFSTFSLNFFNLVPQFLNIFFSIPSIFLFNSLKIWTQFPLTPPPHPHPHPHPFPQCQHFSLFSLTIFFNFFIVFLDFVFVYYLDLSLYNLVQIIRIIHAFLLFFYDNSETHL